MTITKEVNKSLKGYIVEVKAELWLRSMGYEVYYNRAPCGKADLVIWDNESTPIPVDIKCFNSIRYAEAQAHGYPGLKYLWYNQEQDKFAWTNSTEADSWWTPAVGREHISSIV